MAIQDLDPQAAHDAMSGDAAHTFLDVRTVDEYEAGHPVGSINVPWAIIDSATGQMTPNPAFVATVRKHVSKEHIVYASCQSGIRSLNACHDLEAAGYEKLVNVSTGFGGKRDPMGNLIAPGWKDAGLPVEASASNYEQLKG